MSIQVNDFQWEPGKNDAEYIKLLESSRDEWERIAKKAILKLKTLSKAQQEPRVTTLEVAKEARICWIEERDVGIVYPAIYECIGNRSKYGQFSVFTVVSDADILPEELDDDDKLVCDFEEGRRWLWEADYNDVWRCWTSRPSDEVRRATPWN